MIPFTLAAVHLAGIPFSGASVNPARSFGPALVSGSFNQVWIYLVAPLGRGRGGMGVLAHVWRRRTRGLIRSGAETSFCGLMTAYNAANNPGFG